MSVLSWDETYPVIKLHMAGEEVFGILEYRVPASAELRECQVRTYGQLRNVDTSAFSQGDRLFSTTSGGFSGTESTGAQEIGQVEKVGENGVVFVEVIPMKGILGSSGTKAEFNAALTDGDFLFVGDITLQTMVSFPGKLVAGGAGDVVFYATDDGLVGGDALFSSIVGVIPILDVADPLVSISKPVVSNGTKTITTNIKTSQTTSVLGISVLSADAPANAPNGTSVSFLITGILA